MEPFDSFATPLASAKNNLRRAVREILVLCAISFFGLYYGILYSEPPAYRFPGDCMTTAIVLFLPAAFILWFIYRILRFALDR